MTDWRGAGYSNRKLQFRYAALIPSTSGMQLYLVLFFIGFSFPYLSEKSLAAFDSLILVHFLLV